MATIYAFKNFNNYYNRRVKGADIRTIDDFINAFGDYSYMQTGTTDNFDYNDGVMTTHVLGRQSNPYDGECNYILVCKDNNTIDHKWFIIDQDKQCYGQYKLSLYRDVVADHWDLIKEAPMFIEKAIIPDNNPLIFNAENMEVNQIFTDHTLLKDETKCGWYVGYYAKNATGLTGTVKTNDIEAETYKVLQTPIANWDYAAYNSGNPFKGNITSVSYNTLSCSSMSTPAGGTYYERFRYEYNVITNSFGVWSDGRGRTALYGGSGYNSQYPALYRAQAATLNASLKANYYNYHNVDETADFFSYNNKLVLDSAGKYYRISISPAGNDSRNLTIDSSSGAMFNSMTDLAHAAGMTGTPDNNTFTIHVEAPLYVLSYTEMQNLETVYNIPDNLKLTTEDQPYDIFAIPYGEVKIKYTDNNVDHELTTTKEIADATIAAILDQQADKVYDAQLIGYCPMQYLITNEEEITITDSLQASFIKHNNTNVGVIFNVPSSRFSLNIPVNVSTTNYKMSVVCDSYRLTAPDQSSYFDFNAAKNYGIHTFNIDVDLRPFNCYVHANPDFNGLYGQDWNTGRGLIYGNNLSLSRALNKYTEYQIQNSQFQNIFDRSVQNMEVNHYYDMYTSKWSAGLGVLQGGVSGGTGGAMIGGVPGAIAGAAVGGLASGLGAGLDLKIKQELYNEALDYKKDLFGFNLKNIQMQPNTLTRITALNQNNTLWIALDFYTCTDTEREAVAQKIAWNSMTINVVGKITDYLDNVWSYGAITDKGYIKGKLIRLEGLNDDTHVLNAIADELYKGVYTK